MRAVHSLVLSASLLCALLLALRLTPLGSAHAAATAEDTPRLAVCAIPMLVNELMQSDRFLPEREKLGQEFEAELNEMFAKLKEMDQSLQGADRNDPAVQERFRALAKLDAEFTQKRREFSEAMEKKSAEQLLACYELAKSSAAAVAESLGYDFVFASIGPDEKLAGESVELALRQMMARPVVVAPKDADITEDVRDDLKL